MKISDYAILGGDVYLMKDGILNTTYDSWYFNRNETNSVRKFILESSKRAINYIIQYHDKNGSDYYYSIVFEAIKGGSASGEFNNHALR